MRRKPDGPDVKYSSFVTAANGAAVVAGSTLKGVLGAWLKRRAAPQNLMTSVFGTQERGGKAEFHDAPLQERAPGRNDDRWWDAARGTCLAPGVALDPRTRTASERLLYYTEFAPEGSKFAVTITAQDLETAEVEFLMEALDIGFADSEDPIRIGADTADGWGLMVWSDVRCEVIEKEDVAAWLRSGAQNSHSAIYRAVATRKTTGVLLSKRSCLLLDIRLRFEGALLINDPSQFRARNEKIGDAGMGHATVKRRNDQYFLPGSGVRGALRAQARRIWQTISHEKSGDLNAATAVEAKRKGDQKLLPALLRMMGAPGWRTPMTVPDFELHGKAGIHRQEFVAVDRFTGGAAEEKKFSAQGLNAPEFRGTISIDLRAWHNAAVGGWAVVLLLFLLRDLIEGDIQFGLGSSRGYGACVADIGVRRLGGIPEEFEGNDLEKLVRGALERNDAALENALLVEWERELHTLAGVAA